MSWIKMRMYFKKPENINYIGSASLSEWTLTLQSRRLKFLNHCPKVRDDKNFNDQAMNMGKYFVWITGSNGSRIEEIEGCTVSRRGNPKQVVKCRNHLILNGSVSSNYFNWLTLRFYILCSIEIYSLNHWGFRKRIKMQLF